MFLHLTIANPFLIEINEEQRLVFFYLKSKDLTTDRVFNIKNRA